MNGGSAFGWWRNESTILWKVESLLRCYQFFKYFHKFKGTSSPIDLQFGSS